MCKNEENKKEKKIKDNIKTLKKDN